MVLWLLAQGRNVTPDATLYLDWRHAPDGDGIIVRNRTGYTIVDWSAEVTTTTDWSTYTKTTISGARLLPHDSKTFPNVKTTDLSKVIQVVWTRCIIES